jgi:hypothetical protein
MTLSHCWGHKRFETLLKGNQAAFEKRIIFEDLPKTFQDSILVAQRFSIAYLWIDSLCIIQDSLEDWRKESVLMGNVYSSSYCNISATAAVDGADGLFCDGQMSDLRMVQLSAYNDERPLSAHHSDFFTKSIDSAPLNKRGWVLQERLLSRCNLHFGEKQLLWECCEENACEIMPDGLVSGIDCPLMKNTVSIMRGLKPLRIHGDRIDLWAYGKWADIVQAYTEALLTRQTDRLVAISGLASIFQDFYASHYPTRPEYLAGIWAQRAHLVTQLLWHAQRIRTTPDSSSTFIAPTWSWASVDGPINDVFNFSHTAVDMITFPFPYAITTLVNDNDLFGQVSSGRLSLRGKLARISYTALPVMTTEGVELPPHGILKIQEYRPTEDFSWYTRNLDSSNIIYTNIWWDRLLCPGSTIANGCLFLLPIRGEPLGDENYMEGLILESTHPRSTTTSKILSLVPSEFRRVGKWTSYNRASVERIRAGCRYFDFYTAKKGEVDLRRENYDVWQGMAYAINII